MRLRLTRRGERVLGELTEVHLAEVARLADLFDPVEAPAATTVTGTPLSAALPDTSRRSGSVRSLIETPATLVALAIRTPSCWWP